MNGHLCVIDFCSQPEPIFIPFKQLLPHRFPFARSEVACTVILAHVKSLFYIGFYRQKSKCPRVDCGGVYRGENRRRQHNDGRQQGGRAEKDLCERVHPKFLSLSCFLQINDSEAQAEFYGPFYGRARFRCKTVQLCGTHRESEIANYPASATICKAVKRCATR